MLLLDTNVVSELRRVQAGKADRHVAAWARSVDASELYISVVTVQELEVGVLLAERRDRKQGQILRRWLEDQVLPTFADRTLPVTQAIARRSAALQVLNPCSVFDGLIAATAFVHNMRLVTRNVADFAFDRLTVINPWQPVARR